MAMDCCTNNAAAPVTRQKCVEDLPTPSELEPLFQPLTVGGRELATRVVYAPLARCRALGNEPSKLAIQYYSERANRGQLMLTEATVVHEQGHGVPNAPGIYTDAQKEAWKPIVDAVHTKGAFFFCQLWYCGRVSHSAYNPGNVLPMSASDIPITDGTTAICPNTFQPLQFEAPRPMENADITSLVQFFREGARAAIECGFDGIEVHGACGYIIDQFLKSSCNKRTDEYGGSVENRSRLCLEILDAIIEEIGADKVGIRLSPYGTFNDVTDEDPHSLYTYLCAQIRKRGIAYVHMIESRVNGAIDVDPTSPQVVKETLTAFRAAAAPLPFIAAGGYTRSNSPGAVQSGHTDMVSLGRWALANPDLLTRWKLDAPLNAYNRATFYTPFAEGYIDYPFLLDTPEGAKYHNILALPTATATAAAAAATSTILSSTMCEKNVYESAAIDALTMTAASPRSITVSACTSSSSALNTSTADVKADAKAMEAGSDSEAATQVSDETTAPNTARRSVSSVLVPFQNLLRYTRLAPKATAAHAPRWEGRHI